MPSSRTVSTLFLFVIIWIRVLGRVSMWISHLSSGCLFSVLNSWLGMLSNLNGTQARHLHCRPYRSGLAGTLSCSYYFS
ncbi:hypothetical protein PILCRDRAFT_501666 [Piloderma croceum F 1598]|uniref:Uncharacterized protein n=1 Tax=Piloderma croceum (strain F 1598) TaxID=765440 RepID=A0A0C3FNT5_PILCF|nr:hypothetical protein PILCRDRAFT_501666 [Piloderma croceum F 1598]